MRRFDDDEEDENLFPDTEGNNEQEQMNNSLELMQLNLVQIDMNQKLLHKTVQFLEKSWFWKFRTKKNKLKIIIETYNIFKYLVMAEFQEDEEEE